MEELQRGLRSREKQGPLSTPPHLPGDPPRVASTGKRVSNMSRDHFAWKIRFLRKRSNSASTRNSSWGHCPTPAPATSALPLAWLTPPDRRLRLPGRCGFCFSLIVPEGPAQCRAPRALGLHTALSPALALAPWATSLPPACTCAPCPGPRGNERKRHSKRAFLFGLPTRLAPVGLAPHLRTQSRHLSTGRQAAAGAPSLCGETLPVAAKRLRLPLRGWGKAGPWSVFTRAPVRVGGRTHCPGPPEPAAESTCQSANPAGPSTGSCMLRGAPASEGLHTLSPWVPGPIT